MKIIKNLISDLTKDDYYINSTYRSIHKNLSSPGRFSTIVNYNKKYVPLSQVIPSYYLYNSLNRNERKLCETIVNKFGELSKWGKEVIYYYIASNILKSNAILDKEDRSKDEIKKYLIISLIEDFKVFFNTYSDNNIIEYMSRVYNSYSKKRDILNILPGSVVRIRDYYIGGLTIFINIPNYNEFIVNPVLGVNNITNYTKDIIPIAFISVKNTYVKKLRWLMFIGKQEDIDYTNLSFIVDENIYNNKNKHGVFIRYVDFLTNSFDKSNLKTIYTDLINYSLDGMGYHPNKLITFLNKNDSKLKNYTHKKYKELNINSDYIEKVLNRAFMF